MTIMDYFAIIPNRYYLISMCQWLEDNVTKKDYMWDIAPGARVLYFKFESDLLVFRLRWGSI
jgi:hypothetical protein